MTAPNPQTEPVSASPTAAESDAPAAPLPPAPEEVRDLLDVVRWMFRQERNEIICTPGKLTDLPDAKVRRLEHLLNVDKQVKAMLDRLPPHPPMSDEQMEKVGAVIGAALRKRFGEGSAEEVREAVDAAWPDLAPGGSA